MNEKPALVKYVKFVKKLFVLFSAVAIPAFMVLLVFAFMGVLPCIICAPVLGVGYLAVYGVYAMRVSMGTVIGMEVTDKVVHLKTKRKIWTYDVKAGCVRMKVSRHKFVGTFRTQDSQDAFLFYRLAPLSKDRTDQFTEEEMRSIFPAYDARAEQK